MHFFPFSQTTLCDEISEDKQHKFPLLHRLMGSYDGLCEVICNLAIQDNLLGNEGKFESIALNKLNITDTHIMHNFSFFDKALAFLFNRYPFNIFSSSQKELSGQSAVLFKQKFAGLTLGSYVKFFTFQKMAIGYSSQSHSLLIKKTGADTYSFFDPNHGEFSQLRINELEIAINYTARAWQSTHIAFISGDKYIQSLYNQQSGSVFSAIKNAVKYIFKKLTALFSWGDDSKQPPPPPSPPPPAPTNLNVLLTLLREAENKGRSPVPILCGFETKKTSTWGSKEKAYFDKSNPPEHPRKIEPSFENRAVLRK